MEQFKLYTKNLLTVLLIPIVLIGFIYHLMKRAFIAGGTYVNDIF